VLLAGVAVTAFGRRSAVTQPEVRQTEDVAPTAGGNYGH
jgi:hypothetical protein